MADWITSHMILPGVLYFTDSRRPNDATFYDPTSGNLQAYSTFLGSTVTYSSTGAGSYYQHVGGNASPGTGEAGAKMLNPAWVVRGFHTCTIGGSIQMISGCLGRASNGVTDTFTIPSTALTETTIATQPMSKWAVPVTAPDTNYAFSNTVLPFQWGASGTDCLPCAHSSGNCGAGSGFSLPWVIGAMPQHIDTSTPLITVSSVGTISRQIGGGSPFSQSVDLEIYGAAYVLGASPVYGNGVVYFGLVAVLTTSGGTTDVFQADTAHGYVFNGSGNLQNWPPWGAASGKCMVAASTLETNWVYPSAGFNAASIAGSSPSTILMTIHSTVSGDITFNLANTGFDPGGPSFVVVPPTTGTNFWSVTVDVTDEVTWQPPT